MPTTAVRRTRPTEMSEDQFAEWLHERRDIMSIGGTAAGAILGLNPDRTPADVWDGLMDMGTQERRNRRMDRGHMMEGIIATIFEEETMRSLTGDGQTRVRHSQFSFLHATCDRGQQLQPNSVLPRFIQQVSPRNARGVLEIKCLGTRTYQQTKADGIAPMYYAQLQHYLDVLDCRWGSFACFNAEEWQLHWFDVPRDERFIAAMRVELHRFWNEQVLLRQRPGEQQAEPVVAAPRHVGTEAQIVDSPVWHNALVALVSAKEALALAETNFDMARNVVKELMETNGHERVRVPGIGTVNWLARTTTTLDRALLAQDYPDIDLAAYTRTTESRAFTLRPERAGRS